MAAQRRSTGLLGDCYTILAALFKIVSPWTCFPLAVLGFALIFGVWRQMLTGFPGLLPLGYVSGTVFALTCLLAGWQGTRFRRHRQKLLQVAPGLAHINQLSWQDFERLVGQIYREQGYRVTELGGGGADGGVDLKLERSGQTTLVQCKQWKANKVGVKPVRELFGVCAAEGARRAIFITSGVFTQEAMRFAEDKPLELIDGAQLAQMLRQIRRPAQQSASQPPASQHALSSQTINPEVP